MRPIRLLPWLVAPAALLLPRPGIGQTAWDTANAAVVRLLPSAFPLLPEAVRADLEARRCRIPQASPAESTHNVIHGAFIQPGQLDWAILCSRGDTSRILVYRGGGSSGVDELADEPDRNSLQALGSGRIGYSRVISPARAEDVQEPATRHWGDTAPRVDHAGLRDSFLEKASAVWYWSRGRWWRLPDGD